MDSKKSNKITDIVRLQQILKKWRKHASTSKATKTNTTNNNAHSIKRSKSISFLKRTLSFTETYVASNSVPKGYLAVWVGEEMKRFIIPTEYLGHRAFHVLLREAEEEFGFQQTGVLRIPCEVDVFESILKIVEQKKDVFFFNESCGFDCDESPIFGSSSNSQQQTPAHHPQSPFCR